MDKYQLRVSNRAALLSACIAASLAAPATAGPTGFVTHAVTNCDDDGPGSLRDALRISTDFDAVDMTGLQCSTITLASGELVADADNLFLLGNNATVTAAGASRVIAHHGTGLLRITQLTIADGYLSEARAHGGCVYSHGDLYLGGVDIHGCRIKPVFGAGFSFAFGGAAYARRTLSLSHASVTGNVIEPPRFGYTAGNGIAAGDRIQLTSSVVSGNTIDAECRVVAYECAGFHGGGIYAPRGVWLYASTVSGNASYNAGGIFSSGGASHIFNSTISDNHSYWGASGLYSNDDFLEIRNSTIAFNTSELASPASMSVGVLALGSGEYLSLHSSIVANNTRADGVPSDIYLTRYIAGQIVGESSLVIAANQTLPPDTTSADPLLGPLGDYGNGLPTRRLLPGSPAIDAGSNPRNYPFDERGAPRVSGLRADIGAFELVQAPPPERIFADGFDGSTPP